MPSNSTLPDSHLAVILAAEFSRQLRATLEADEVAEAVRRNAVETDQGVCHSHDFCDANMVMEAAFNALKLPLWDRSGQIPESATIRWNAAWDIAKAAGFAVEPVFGGFTQSELHAAFDLVKDEKHWKNPVNKLLPKAVGTEPVLSRVSAAIAYICGSESQATPTTRGVRVRAAGYFASIGS